MVECITIPKPFEEEDNKCQCPVSWNFRYDENSDRIIDLEINCEQKSIDLTKAFKNLNLGELKNVCDTVDTPQKCDQLIYNGTQWVNQHVKEVSCLDRVAGVDACGCPTALSAPTDGKTHYLSTDASGKTRWTAIAGADGDIDLSHVAMVDGDGNIVYADLSEVLDGIIDNFNQQIKNVQATIQAIIDKIYGWPLANGIKIATGNMRYHHSIDGGVTYPYYLAAADEGDSNRADDKVS